MHVEKVKLGGGNFKRLRNHMKRESDYYKNDVDRARSHLNISLRQYVDDLEGFIRGQGVKRIRKDAVGAYNAICTVAKEDKASLVTEKDYKSWGWTAIDATLTAFGLTRDDLVGAEIHVDEGKTVEDGNAHVHFSFVPLVREDKKVALSAKRVGNKQAFKDLHDVLQAEMTARGYKGTYVNADEVRGLSKESLEEYKRSQEVIPKLRAEIQALKEDNDFLRSANKKFTEENDRINEQIKKLQELREKLSKLSFFEKIASKKIKAYDEKLAEKDKAISELSSQVSSLSTKVKTSPSMQLQSLYKQVEADLDKASRRINALEKDNRLLVKENSEYAQRLGLTSQDLDKSERKQGLAKLLDEITRD